MRELKDIFRDPFARTCAVVVLTFLFYLTSMLYFLTSKYDGNYSGFLHISAGFLKKNPLVERHPEAVQQLIVVEDSGYDGQLFYFMAFDPFLSKLENVSEYRNVVDVPAFRYRRIGFALVTHLIAFGRPEFYPAVMIWLILVSHIAGSIFLVKIAQVYGKDPLWAILYILIPGYSLSLMFGLPESIAGALLLGGFYFHLKKQFTFSLLCFALSLLFRETGILLISVLGIYEAFRTKSLKPLLIVASAAIPYFVWRLYVTIKLFSDSGWGGFFEEPKNLALPLKGVFQLYGAISKGEYLPYIVPAGIILPMILFGALLLAIWSFRKRRTPQALALIGYSALALSLSFDKVWIHVANAERQSFETFLCLFLTFLSTSAAHFALTKAFLGLFGILFLFDFLFSAADVSFRAALHWILS